MLEVESLKKLTVGDIAAYERHIKEERKKELIATTKELYGDKIPPDAVSQIERELKRIPSIFDDGDIDAKGIQYLLWLSAKKTDPDITLKQVGDAMNTDNLAQYVSALLPQPDSIADAEKKT